VRTVVVAYHAADALSRCLAALDGSTEVTVVDNSSSGDVRAVAERHGAAYIDPGTNLGFAAGVNVALAKLTAGEPCDVLLLNPDAVLGPDEVQRLSSFLHGEGNARVAAVSPALIDEHGHEQRVVWPYPTPARAWAEAAGLWHLPAQRTFVIGSVLLLRWEALQDVGNFDERFFLYAEETDWQRRAAQRDWTAALCSTVTATHTGAGTSPDERRREALFHAAHETYLRKWHGPAGWLVYRSAVLAGSAARALVFKGERRAEATRRARIYVHGPRRSAFPE
jgi:GT2 family glycosyltransferase